MFFENFSKDYRQPDFYMRFFQAIYLSDFYQFVRQYSNSQIYNWHTTLDVSFPFLDFFPQIFEKTRMSHLFNYQNVCKMIDELKHEILSGKTFFCFIQRTTDECFDYNRAFKLENINSEDVSHDSSYVKITSDEWFLFFWLFFPFGFLVAYVSWSVIRSKIRVNFWFML